MQEAMYYEKLSSKKVHCRLCPHHCMISDGQIGLCRVRKNIQGKLYTLNYGHLSGIAIDPIEKKPLNRFMPGSHILSVGSYGCNMKCLFCQNADIAREFKITNQYTEPRDVIQSALDHELPSIAYTYNEPTVYYEWMIATARLSKEKGLKNVMVSNGFIEKEPFEVLAPFIDAMNIDVKTYDDTKYQSICGGRLEPVLETIERALNHKIHVELTSLIVPGLNDELEKLDVLFKQLYERIGDLDIHISRYFPRYHYDEPATNIQLMLEIKERARKYFTQVYLGNVR